jgi:EAL and modified HD-GYP domain-containing signal transduction protein
VAGREVPALKQNLLRLLGEAYRDEPDHRKIAGIIRHDVGLAFKLLVHLRGVAWGQWRPVESVQRALLLLGDAGLRRWASIVAMATLGHDRPSELIVSSLVRAAFCEGMLTDLGRPERAEDGFLMGLFSMIDALLGQPLPEALDRLALDDAVRSALVGGDSPLRPVLDLALAYERGHWPVLARLAAALGATDEALTSRYREALAFGDAAMRHDPGT